MAKTSACKRRPKDCLVSGLLLAMLLIPVVRASDLDLSAYRGKVVYVDFWASWCGPCRESFPWLGNLVREFSSRDFVVIAVNVDKDRARAERFLDNTPADFPIVYDPRGDIATAYNVAGMPSAVLIDRDGHVRFQHAGFSAKKEEQYEADLLTLLNEKTH